MKIEAEILTVKNGKIDEIKIMEQIYRCYIPSDSVLKIIKADENKPKRKYVRHKPLHRHYKPKDGVAFVKEYCTWIKEDEINKVKLAINKVAYGYKPTANVIANETKLRMYRVLAILRYLKESGFAVIKEEGRKTIYQSEDNDSGYIVKSSKKKKMRLDGNIKTTDRRTSRME